MNLTQEQARVALAVFASTEVHRARVIFQNEAAAHYMQGAAGTVEVIPPHIVTDFNENYATVADFARAYGLAEDGKPLQLSQDQAREALRMMTGAQVTDLSMLFANGKAVTFGSDGVRAGTEYEGETYPTLSDFARAYGLEVSQ